MRIVVTRRRGKSEQKRSLMREGWERANGTCTYVAQAASKADGDATAGDDDDDDDEEWMSGRGSWLLLKAGRCWMPEKKVEASNNRGVHGRGGGSASASLLGPCVLGSCLPRLLLVERRRSTR